VTAPVPAAALTRARIGTTATFGLGGAVCAVWTVRIPALTDKLHLNPGQVGTAVLCTGLGALISMQVARMVIGRVGSRRALLVAGPGTAVLSAGLGMAPSYAWLLVAAAAFGLVFGVLDMGMNTQAAMLERVTGRHLMNGAHAGWSIGSVAGGGLGALSAYLGWSFTQAVLGMAALALPVAVVLAFTYLPDPPLAAAASARHGRIPPVIYLIGAVTCASFLIEGAIANWSGLYLRNELGTREALAALAYPSFEVAMIIGRTLGDGVRRRIGSRRMLVGAGIGVSLAFAVVVAAPSWWVALTGFFLAGLAVSTVVPLTFSIAGALDETGAGVAQAGAMGYGGMLIGPVGIGYLANATSVRTGLVVPLVLGAVVSVLGRLLPAGPAAGPPVEMAPVPFGERLTG
jgi:MFS family permease